jgi:arylsulfatase A-like enzyme
LLARRLIEAGVRFVTTVNGPSIVWDTHGDNFNRLKNQLVPPMEQAFAALLDDLDAHGLLESTLLVWMGDFGRTPAINGGAGRDHWPHVYSMVLAGGGIRGGQVIGASDRHGAYPRAFPVSPADIHATVFTALGYDPHCITYLSPEGRPFPLSEGQAIQALL